VLMRSPLARQRTWRGNKFITKGSNLFEYQSSLPIHYLGQKQP
jgi:hypothetical protein